MVSRSATTYLDPERGRSRRSYADCSALDSVISCGNIFSPATSGVVPCRYTTPPSRLVALPFLPVRSATSNRPYGPFTSAGLIPSSITGRAGAALSGRRETARNFDQSPPIGLRGNSHEQSGQPDLRRRSLGHARCGHDAGETIPPSVLPIRAKPFTPVCRGCQQAGRTHMSPPTYPQRYVCVNCRRRWIGVPNFR